jgi:hypothetical protein
MRTLGEDEFSAKLEPSFDRRDPSPVDSGDGIAVQADREI